MNPFLRHTLIMEVQGSFKLIHCGNRGLKYALPLLAGASSVARIQSKSPRRGFAVFLHVGEIWRLPLVSIVTALRLGVEIQIGQGIEVSNCRRGGSLNRSMVHVGAGGPPHLAFSWDRHCLYEMAPSNLSVRSRKGTLLSKSPLAFTISRSR